MKNWLVVLLFVVPVFGIAQNWQQKDMESLDHEQFRRLENGETELEEIPKIIISKSGKKPSVYLVNAYTVLGIANKNKGYYVSSLNYSLLALSAAERLHDRARISACLNNIGILFFLQENYKKAIHYFNRSLKLEEQLQKKDQKSIRLFNLGDAYKQLNQFDEAMGYYTASLLIERDLKNPIGISYALLGQADVYQKMERSSDVKSALEQIVLTDLDKEGQIEYHRIKGELFTSEGEFTEGISELQRGIQLANAQHNKTSLSQLYLLLGTAYEKKADFRAANQSYKQHIALHKSLQSNLIKNQLEDLTYQNELQQKEMRIRYLRKQHELSRKNELAQKRLRAFDWRIVLFSIASLIGIVVTVILGTKKLLSTRS